MKNPLQTQPISRYLAWGLGISRIFPTYEEAWRFSEKVFAHTGLIVAIEPVYAI